MHNGIRVWIFNIGSSLDHATPRPNQPWQDYSTVAFSENITQHQEVVSDTKKTISEFVHDVTKSAQS